MGLAGSHCYFAWWINRSVNPGYNYIFNTLSVFIEHTFSIFAVN